jgi:hypothetical protein
MRKQDYEEAFVNVAVCAVDDGRKTQDASWLETEAMEEGVVYLVNMVRGGQKQTRVRAEGRLCLPNEKVHWERRERQEWGMRKNIKTRQ